MTRHAPPPGTLTVAAVQMTSRQDVAANLATATRLTLDAASAGAQVVGLPENFAFLGVDGDHMPALAETLGARASGPILRTMQDVARRAKVWLLLGGFPERSRDKGRIHNTSVLLDPRGRVVARYRKIHLFDVEVPGGTRFRESERVAPGGKAVVARTPWGGLGLSVCYDLRFPELYRALASAGARMLAVPSAFTRETGKDHWHLLLRARAIENQAFVMAPAQFGHHGGNRWSYGHALVIDPWGAVIAECGDHEGFALGRLDFSYQDAVRTRLPCLRHRRLR